MTVPLSNNRLGRPARRAGFSLVELLAAAGVLMVLASLALPLLGRGIEAGRRSQCIARLRALGAAATLYAHDNGGCFPRSSHSAFGYGSKGWQRDVMPYLGRPGQLSSAEFAAAKRDLLHCPSDTAPHHGSYGLNVHFELDPEFDDYAGSPATWRRPVLVPNPVRTIWFAELAESSSADHIMAHFWEGTAGAVEVAASRHLGRSNYLFVDGHAETLGLSETFDPTAGVNLWNPALAR